MPLQPQKDHPIDLALKEKRSAGYKVLCTWDKLLCDTLNAAGNTTDGEEIQALIQKLFDKARTPREKAEYAPPDYYRQLSPLIRIASPHGSNRYMIKTPR